MVPSEVGRQVQVIQHQLTAAGHRDPVHAVAPVQIHQLHQAVFDGQLHPPGAVHRHGRQGHQPRHRRPVGVAQGIHQEGGVVVLGPGPVILRQGLPQQGGLVHMIAAGGIPVHLLDEIEVRMLLGQERPDVSYVVRQPLLGPGPGLRSAVHKEAVIRLIGAEADVIGQQVIFPAGLGGLKHLPVHLQVHVPQPVIVDEHIGQVSHHQQHQGRQHQQDDFQRFVHETRLLVYKSPFVYYNRSQNIWKEVFS